MIAESLVTVANILNVGLTIGMWAIIIRAFLSWIKPDPYNGFVQFIYRVTEPYLSRIRKYLPINFGGADFSPVIAVIGIIFIKAFVIQSLWQLGSMLKSVG